MKYDFIGKGIVRHDGVEKVTGDAEYVQDIKMTGMLYARLKTSTVAHGYIKSIDISRAKELPGVKAVITGKEAYQKLGIYISDRSSIAVDKVRYYGEVVAAVAAIDIDTAEKAVELIEVEYEKLPVLQDVEEAIKPDAILIHPDLKTYRTIEGVYFPQPDTNIANHFKLRKGDVEAGFKASDYIVENRFEQPQVLHIPMETHSVIAKWGAGDKIKIWSSAQSPFAIRDLFSIAMGVPLENIEVIVPYIGGGFGGKSGIHQEPIAALLSKAAKGKPVKLIATREEETSTLPCRQGLIAKVKTGVTKEGRILAEEVEYLWDAGAYADYGVNIGRAAGYSGCGPYEIENVKIDSKTIYTNHIFATAYRGFGHAEFFWAIERQREIIAKLLNMDSLEFRLKNLLKNGSKTITGELITENSGRVDECLRLVAESVGWGSQKTEEQREEEKRTGKFIGRGIAVLHKAPAMPTSSASSAVIQMNENGSIRFNVGGIDMGQGTYTALSQIIGERLHIPIEKVHAVASTSTDSAPYDWQTVASRMTVLAGNAVVEACDDLLDQIYEIAGEILHATKHELALGDSYVYVKQRPNNIIPFNKIAAGFTFPNGNSIGGPLIGRGKSIAQGLTTLDKETGQGIPALDWTFGAHGIELEVDKFTGDIRIIKIASSFDVGKIMNIKLLKGQVVGGVIQGVGTALSEGMIYNAEGKLLTKNFVDYKIPTMQDLPEAIELHFVETPQLDGPYGARGCAEHPMISITAVIGNAIANATGVEIYNLPFSSDKIFEALNA